MLKKRKNTFIILALLICFLSSILGLTSVNADSSTQTNAQTKYGKPLPDEYEPVLVRDIYKHIQGYVPQTDEEKYTSAPGWKFVKTEYIYLKEFGGAYGESYAAHYYYHSPAYYVPYDKLIGETYNQWLHDSTNDNMNKNSSNVQSFYYNRTDSNGYNHTMVGDFHGVRDTTLVSERNYPAADESQYSYGTEIIHSYSIDTIKFADSTPAAHLKVHIKPAGVGAGVVDDGEIKYDGTPGCDGTNVEYSPGSTLNLKAEAREAKGIQYVFDHWEGHLTGTNPNQSLLMDSDKTITAVFRNIKDPPLPQPQPTDSQHNLTVVASQGGSAGDSCQLKKGESKTLWEKPTSGYKFTGWTSDCTDVKVDDNNNIVMPDHDVTVTANFAKYSNLVNLTVKASPESAGTVTGGGNEMLVNGKAKFTGITQKPSSNAPQDCKWVFDHWGSVKGDNVTPDASGTVNITQDTTLVAYYRLANNSTPVNVGGDESSILTINASVDSSYDNKKSSDRNTTIAKEGQMVTFNVKTASNDYRYREQLNGLYYGHTYPPDEHYYSNSGFQGNLENVQRDYHWYEDDDDYYWWWTASYNGHIFRNPVEWYSAYKLNFSFPNEMSHPSTDSLNSALKEDLNTGLNANGTMEWFIQSSPNITSYNDSSYDNKFGSDYNHQNHSYQNWKQNTEQVKFYVPLTTPVTINENGIRLREPYTIHIQAVETNGTITADTDVKLDVKGNIYQGIYTTPIG